MNRLNLRPQWDRTRFLNRLANVSLSVFLGLSGFFQLVRLVHALRDGDSVLALYQGLIGLSSVIMATLVLTRKPAVTKDAAWGPRVTAAVGTFIVFPLGALPLTWNPDWLLSVTSGVLILSYVWIVWALLTLRRSFSVFPEARALITHGPYALVRHPLYAAYFLTYACVVLPRIGLLSILLMTIGVSAEVMRSRNEERVLRSVFSDYAGYAQRVPAFFPAMHRLSKVSASRGAQVADAVAPR
jgi:protein-S-isoprenylcysteine O-methyltransferase Ste14